MIADSRANSAFARHYGNRKMNRRHVLKTAATTAVGAGLLVSGATEAASEQAASARARPRSGDFVEAADGTKLADTDWGSGRPIVIGHAWALPSPMWDYQRGPLSQQGLRCIAYDRRGHGRWNRRNSGWRWDTLPT